MKQPFCSQKVLNVLYAGGVSWNIIVPLQNLLRGITLYKHQLVRMFDTGEHKLKKDLEVWLTTN